MISSLLYGEDGFYMQSYTNRDVGYIAMEFIERLLKILADEDLED